jgi:hypothetical protein
MALSVGPTYSKVLMTSIHLCYPELGLLNEACPVGVGAQSPLCYMFGVKNTKCEHISLDLLREALVYFRCALPNDLAPVFLPMLEFTVSMIFYLVDYCVLFLVFMCLCLLRLWHLVIRRH